jgi:hypothetical protein
MGKDFSIPMLDRKFTKPTGAVVDTKLEGVTRAGFNIIVHEIALVFLFVTTRGLLANESLTVVGHKFPARFRFGSKADICGATTHVRFAPNSDRESEIPHKVMSALLPKVNIHFIGFLYFSPFTHDHRESMR